MIKNVTLCLIFFLFGAITLYSQNVNIDIARSEFYKGNYKDAIGLYNGAIALAKDSKEKDQFTVEREKSSTCWKYLDKADILFSQSKYKQAVRFYSLVLSLNSKDSYAKQRENLCNAYIQKEIKLAEENRRLDKLVKELLTSNNLEQIKVFVDKYPQHKSIENLKDIIDYHYHYNIYEKKSTFDKQCSLLKIAKLYNKYNKTVAYSFYEKAAMCGSLDAFYDLAISQNDKTSKLYKRLMFFAAANGFNEAEKNINKTSHLYVGFDAKIAKNLYSHLLKANNGSLYSIIYIQKHKHILGLPKLNMLNDQIEYNTSDSNLLYELSLLYEGDIAKRDAYLLKAASLGNDEALFQLGKVQTDLKNRAALYLCAAMKGNYKAELSLVNFPKESKIVPSYFMDLKYGKEYVKYLKGETCNWFDVYMFLNFSAKKYLIHDIDAYIVSCACYKYLDRKSYKRTTNLLKRKQIWDESTIKNIRAGIEAYGSKMNRMHKKILKYLTKVQTRKNIRKPEVFEQLVHKGLCDDFGSRKWEPIHLTDFVGKYNR